MVSITGIMDSPAATAAVFGCLAIIVWYISSTFRSWYRLSHIPGPRLASVSHLWGAINTLQGKNYQAYLDLKKYGPLVRNGPNYLVTDDPNVLRSMAEARSRYTRDKWFSAIQFRPGVDNMGSVIDTATHDALKVKVSPAYNRMKNPDLEPGVDSQLLRLIDLIRRKHISTSESLKAVDFSLLSRYFTLDIVTRLGCGKAFGYLDEGTDVYGWIGTVDPTMGIAITAMDTPWIRKVVFSPWVFSMVGPKQTDEKGVGKMVAATKKVIEDRLAEGKDYQDMLGSFISRGLTQLQLESETMVQIIAGSDTSSVVIRSTMLHIMTAPHVYSRLKAEIKEAVEAGVSSPITYAEALKIPYLQAVINEGYRIKCPVLYGHYKVVPPEGDTVCGYFVPGGTAIGHNSVALTHNESVFGPDVDAFRPERFLECDDEKRLEMERALDITFGGGRWQCAGKTIVKMELNKIFFELLRIFDFQIISPGNPWKELSYLSCVHKDMFVRITEAAP